jgi:hypothetical protein
MSDTNDVNFQIEIDNQWNIDGVSFNFSTSVFPDQLPPVDPNGNNGLAWALLTTNVNTLNSIELPTYINISDWGPSNLSVYAMLLDGRDYTFHVTITAIDTIAPDIILSVKSPENSSLQVYPNPAKDKLVISGNVPAKGTIEILNPLGQVVFQTAYADRRTEITISSFPQGIYFLKMQGENEEVVKSFVKE